MKNKRLALNADGVLTYCTASEENIGKGRCNHIEHQRSDESTAQFMDRTSTRDQFNKLDLKYEGYHLELAKKFMAIQDEVEEYQNNSRYSKIASSLIKGSYEFNIKELNISRLKEDKTDIKINKFLKKFITFYNSDKLDDPDDVKYVNDAINDIMAYGQELIMSDSNIEYVRQNFSGEELRKVAIGIDRKRRDMHNIAMSGLHLLNKLANLYGFDEVYTKEISNENRSTITDDIRLLVESSI